MTRIRFTDGVSFDTSGDLRTERRFDGLYVVGKGFLCPVADEKEAEELIERFKERRRRK